MRCTDASDCKELIIGKALGILEKGEGVISLLLMSR